MKDPWHCFQKFSPEYLGDRWENSYLCTTFALVAKLVDAPDLGSGAARREGSSPFRRTPLMNAKYRFIPAIQLFFIPVEDGCPTSTPQQIRLIRKIRGKNPPNFIGSLNNKKC